MNRQPAVSVIIPLYNKGPYILRSVRSALAQRPRPAEVLVIDDGSSDNGPEILDDLQDQGCLRVVRQVNAGEGAARNRGLAEMRGDLAAFLDADDEWLPEHLRNLMELTRLYPRAGLYGTGYRTVYATGAQVETRVAGTSPVLLQDYFAAARGGFCLHISSCAAWKTEAQQAGGFKEREPLGADLEFFARMALRHAVALHPAVSGMYYAGHPGSALRANRWASTYPPVVRLLHECRTENPDLPASFVEYADWILIEHALTGLYAGEKNKAARILSEIRSFRPAPAPSAWLARLGQLNIPLSVLRPLIRMRRSRWVAERIQNPCAVMSRVV